MGRYRVPDSTTGSWRGNGWRPGARQVKARLALRRANQRLARVCGTDTRPGAGLPELPPRASLPGRPQAGIGTSISPLRDRAAEGARTRSRAPGLRRPRHSHLNGLVDEAVRRVAVAI